MKAPTLSIGVPVIAQLGQDGPTTEREANRRRALSEKLPRLTWKDLRVGLRIHYASGWLRTSWTAEVRSAPIDGQVVVIWKTVPDGGSRRGGSYEVLDRIAVDVFPIRIGRIPRGACERRGA